MYISHTVVGFFFLQIPGSKLASFHVFLSTWLSYLRSACIFILPVVTFVFTRWDQHGASFCFSNPLGSAPGKRNGISPVLSFAYYICQLLGSSTGIYSSSQ